MKLKRWLCLFSLLLCAVLLVACGRNAETVHLPAPTPTAMPAPTPTPGPAVPAEADQRALIERSRSVWQWPDATQSWFYCVTDLDHNGRLEIVTASLQGTGLYTYVSCWEVSEDGTRLVPCPDNTGEGQAWPDIIQESLSGYHDPASGRYTYLCDDLMRDGAARYYSAKTSFCLERGAITLSWYGYKDESYNAQTGETVRSFFDAAGNSVSEMEYDTSAERQFVGQERITLPLRWTKIEGQSVYEPPVQSAQPAQNVKPVVITKHPTSESIAVGGKTWFIAHADNASTLTWEVVSPEGQSYSVADAMAIHPGLQLQVLEGDTIAVSNVPLSMNNWGVRARFDGPGGSAVTSAAKVFVTDYESLYAGPIGKYRTAYRDGNTFAQYAFDNGISEYISSSAHVGYALGDMDGDGVPELLIAGFGADDVSGGVIYDLYTIADGAPLQLACSSARNRYYLRSDGTVLNEGSGGAGYSVFIVQYLQDNGLEPLELCISYFQGGADDGFYHLTDGFSLTPRATDRPISEAEFAAIVKGYEDAVFVPELTMIA